MKLIYVHPQKYKKSILVREKLCSASTQKGYCKQRSMVKREHLCTDCTGLWQACARPSLQACNRTTRFHFWTAYARSETDLWDIEGGSYAGWWCHLSLIAHFGFITGTIKVQLLAWKNGPCSCRSLFLTPLNADLKRHCLTRKTVCSPHTQSPHFIAWRPHAMISQICRGWQSYIC